jgi:hypothetical protein
MPSTNIKVRLGAVVLKVVTLGYRRMGAEGSAVCKSFALIPLL